MNKKIKFLSTALCALILAFSTPLASVNAATAQKTYKKTMSYTSGSSMTVTSYKSMSIVLNPGQSGYSNTITFNFGSLPANAIVKEVKVDASNTSVLGGLGAIWTQKLIITNPLGESEEAAWGRGNVTTTSAFIASKAAGTWSAYCYGTNIASASSSAQFIGGTQYKLVKMTITYAIE